MTLPRAIHFDPSESTAPRGAPCGARGLRVETTTDRSKVTCSNCVKRMGFGLSQMRERMNARGGEG